MDYPVTYHRKVRFSDSDAQGIVFNANYLTYIDDAISDYFDLLEVDWNGMNERGLDIVLGRAELDYRSSGRKGETLITGVRVASIGTSSVVFEITIWEEQSQRVVVEGREIQVMVDRDTFETTPVPPWFVAVIEKLQGPVEWKARP
ncbi:MAG: acyl-CoA thioesterase [Acidimicrobiia bacterium]